MSRSNFRRFLVFVTVFCCWTEPAEIQRRKSSQKQRGSESVPASLFAATNSPKRSSSSSSSSFSSSSSRRSAYDQNVTMTTSPERQTRPFEILNPRMSDVSIECVALRSKRYISDGFCTSVKPVSDVVCTGTCLPIHDLPWYAEFIKVWSRQKTLQHRCVDDLVRVRKVTFLCANGETRTYDIRVVRSCKCKRYIRGQNESSSSANNNNNKKKNNKKNDNNKDNNNS